MTCSVFYCAFVNGYKFSNGLLMMEKRTTEEASVKKRTALSLLSASSLL